MSNRRVSLLTSRCFFIDLDSRFLLVRVILRLHHLVWLLSSYVSSTVGTGPDTLPTMRGLDHDSTALSWSRFLDGEELGNDTGTNSVVS